MTDAYRRANQATDRWRWVRRNWGKAKTIIAECKTVEECELTIDSALAAERKSLIFGEGNV